MILGLLGVGCATDAYLERQTELCHPVLGCVERPFWRDADNDGWGDPAVTERFRFPPDDEPWVDNARDCDDSDPTVTARLGAACLEGAGHVDATHDFLFVVGPLNAYEAAATCGPSGFGGILGGPVRLLDYAGPDWVGWVAVDPGSLSDGWDRELDEQSPVLLTGGVLVSGLANQREAFVCSRPSPDPADFVVIEVPE